MIDCESSVPKNEKLQDTWTTIKARLKQHPNAISANVDLLYPFTAKHQHDESCSARRRRLSRGPHGCYSREEPP